MTTRGLEHPAWGVLTNASAAEVRRVLWPMASRFDLRIVVARKIGGGTVVFNMTPSDTGDMEAGVLLGRAGFEVMHFDFSKYGYATSRWANGQWLEEPEDPEVICDRVGVEVPGHGDPKVRTASPSETRSVAIVDGLGLAEVQGLLSGSRVRIEDGPHGAMLFDADPDVLLDVVERSGTRVFVVDFQPASGYFRVQILRGDECLGTFRPGETRTWDGTPFIDNVLGATTPEEVVKRFEIPDSFLEARRSPDADRA